MAASIVRTARGYGVDPQGLSVVSGAHALAMGPRVAALPDDDHPLYLHPGRTVLVLLLDAGVSDAGVLAAAALSESEDADLRVAGSTVAVELPEDVAALVAAVPWADAPDLAETLVSAPESVRLIALAERLDHLRHAHLRDDAGWRARVHAQAVSVYAPVAERTHPRLAGRYRHWCRMFARRFLES
jgi:(p)ppGpp synthase/HD superfamily hydrolase